MSIKPPRTDFRTSVHISTFLMVRRPWGGRSIVKNPSSRPPQNDNLGPASEFVHEMDGRCINFGPLSTGTSGPSAEGHLRPWWPDVNDRWANDDDFATMNFIIAGLSMMLFFNTLAVYLKIRSTNRANKIQITIEQTEKQDDTETADLWIWHG